MQHYVKPTAMFTPFDGRVVILMFGTPHDWNIKNLCNGHATVEVDDVKDRITAITETWGINTLLVPRPTEFNAKIASPEEFKQETFLSKGTYKLRFLSLAPAEGTEVGKLKQFPGHTGAYFYTAGCAVVTIYNPIDGKVFAAHAGRDSLLDREMIRSNTLDVSKNKSIVKTLLQQFDQKDWPHLKAFVCGTISGYDFAHNLHDPEHGEYNKLMAKHLEIHWSKSITIENDFLYISIADLIRIQLVRNGLKPTHIGFDCCDLNVKVGGSYKWWNHTRDLTESPNQASNRNACFVFTK